MLDLLKFNITARNKTGSAFAGVKEDLRGVKGVMASVSEQATRMGRNMRNVGAGLSLGVTTPLAAMGKQMVTLYDEQVQAEQAVATAITSTGGAAGRTLQQLKGLATGLQDVSTYGDENILRNVTAPLLTFTNIQGDVFDRAQANVLDYATLLKTDLKSAAIQVGKALNDPVKGVSALGEAGVQFSDDQKNMIASLVETGDVAAAQAVILKELETQFKGQAAAAASAPLGQWKQLSNAIGDVKEELGAQVVPFVKPLVDSLKGAVQWFGSLSPEVKRNTVVVAGLAAAAGPLVAGLGLAVMGVTAVGGAFASVGALLLANPIFAAIGLIAGGAALIYKNWDGIKGWFGRLFEGTKAVFSSAWEGIKSTLWAYSGAALIYENWEGITQWFGDLWDRLRVGARVAWDGVRNTLANYTPAGLIYQHWGDIAGWFTEKFFAVRDAFNLGWQTIKALLSGPYSPQVLIKDAWAGIGAWFASLTGEVIAGFQAIWEGVKAEVASWPGRMLQVGKDMVAGLVAGLKGGKEFEKGTAALVQGGIDAARATLQSRSPSRVFIGIGKDIVDGLAIGVRENAGSAVGEVATMTAQIADEAQKSTGILGSFRDGAKSILTSVLSGAQTFRGALAGVLGGWGNRLLTGGINQLFDTVWPFANGGVIQNGRAMNYARGGMVSKPTTFAMAGGDTGLMGEAGPEAIMPLSRGPDGKLGIRAQGGAGGGASDTLHFNFAPVIDARGADPSVVARLNQQVEAMSANMEQRVQTILRNGRNRRNNRAWMAT